MPSTSPKNIIFGARVMSKTIVNIIESEAGWGSKIDEKVPFNTYDEALTFCKDYNTTHNSDGNGSTPEWYMYAVIDGEYGMIRHDNPTDSKTPVWPLGTARNPITDPATIEKDTPAILTEMGAETPKQRWARQLMEDIAAQSSVSNTPPSDIIRDIQVVTKCINILQELHDAPSADNIVGQALNTGIILSIKSLEEYIESLQQ